MSKTPKTVRLLSIDGGGIRGLIPALVLATMEQIAGKPIVEMFDLIAGTSTGGILALGLTMPGANGRPRYSADQLVGLYSEQGGQIFQRDLLYIAESADGLRLPLYQAKSIEATLLEKFAEAQLKDAIKDVLITSYDIQSREVHIFRSDAARKDPKQNFYMRDVARATSAAPTFFSPALIQSLGGHPPRALVDGGVSENNPAVRAYAEAKRDHPKAEVLLVSLGTGSAERAIPYEKAKDWGGIGWAFEMIDVLFDGTSKAAEEQLTCLVTPNARGEPMYYRFQAKLSPTAAKMDDVHSEHIAQLQHAASTLISDRRSDLEKLSLRLLSV